MTEQWQYAASQPEQYLPKGTKLSVYSQDEHTAAQDIGMANVTGPLRRGAQGIGRRSKHPSIALHLELEITLPASCHPCYFITMLTPLPLNKLPPLSSLRGFEAAARLQNLRAAAEELHLTHPAIVNQIQRLEESLGVRLFERQGRHVVLTVAGHRFYPHVREAISTLINGAEAARQFYHAEPLRMQVYVTTSIRWLAPRLVQFYDSHPEVELQVMTYSVGWEFDEANADIAIIYRDKPLPSHLHWVPLFPSQILPVCSPNMLRKIERPLPLKDLRNYPLIEVYTESWSWESWFNPLAQTLPKCEPVFPRGKIVVDTLAAALEMAERGEGVALVNGPFADDALADGRLINPVDQVKDSQGEWGIVCHKDIASSRRAGSLISWLSSQIS